MRNKKGSILLISLWVLLILVVLAIGLGHRSSIALRLSAYQRDSLKASYLAKAGTNKAILLLKEDAIASPSYNGLPNSWSTGLDPLTGKSIIEGVEIKSGSGEIFTVRYYYDDRNYLCMMDEERKININKAADPVFQPLGGIILRNLFVSAEVADPDKLKDLVIKWIDPKIDDQVEDPEGIFKNSDLQAVEELIAILEFFYKDESNPLLEAKKTYERIKDLVTVYGDGMININTINKTTLDFLIQCCKDKVKMGSSLSSEPAYFDELSVKIMDYIFKNNYFIDAALIDQKTLGLSGDFTNIIAELRKIIKVKSDTFRINSTGEITGKGVSKTITCVFSRTSPKNAIVYWREN
jgi:hypothetical protein